MSGSDNGPPLHPQPTGGVAHGYRPLPDSLDEMLGPDARPRPHWQGFLQALDALGAEELTQRWWEARHLIRENGVTYNVYGDPHGMDRPWQLDPIPLLVSAADGAALESGLTQRARLLELVLADIYGPQTLLHQGLLPPELVFGHPGFLRPCHGLKVAGDRRLHLYAADVARGPDGAVWVISDRTQAPSGAGYALENRLVLSRMLPDVFRECRVQRLATFFRTLRETLRETAPHNRDNPRIVLLTPGPTNETYFEHAYLARYLGYTLAEGGDLTVRDNRVYLKLLGGLQPVDVIFRRLDDDFCDPLELRGDSFLGVPGLIQAVRSGNVAVANALGSGLLETPALFPFLPELCRRLLGEDLRAPSVPTFWCGDPRSLDHVLTHLGRMVLKSTFPVPRREVVFGDKLTAKQRQDWADRLRARPHDYVGQDQLALSTAPFLVGRQLQPRHLVLRAYLTPRGDGYAVMPGGLTRVTASTETLVVSMQKGGRSKDTWLLAAGPVSTLTLLSPTVQPIELSRGGGDLPSRAADNLFWLGRYGERVESFVRLLRGILVRLTEKAGLAEVPELPALLRTLTLVTKTVPGFLGAGAEARLADPGPELLRVVFDVKSRGGLAWTVAELTRVAGATRDGISADMWRVLSGLDLAAATVWPGQESRPHDEPPSLSDVLVVLNRMVIALAAFGGLAADSMTRGQGWRFLDMGRRLERSLFLIGLLRGTLATWDGGAEGPLLEAVLEVADSSMTYRRRYLSSLQTAPVLDLLLADEDNPRSLAFQMAALADDVDRLPRAAQHPGRSPEQRVMLAALTAVRLADADALARSDDDGGRGDLGALLSRLEKELPAFAEAVTLHYLSHLLAARQLAAGRPERPR
jgi:uncharacterized circularly permuted ATP-grasp superfamily protein/uncharacterized alpha-E superfamily protein